MGLHPLLHLIQVVGIRVNAGGHYQVAAVCFHVDTVSGIGKAEPPVPPTGTSACDDGGREGVSVVDLLPCVRASVARVNVEYYPADEGPHPDVRAGVLCPPPLHLLWVGGEVLHAV